MKVLRKSAINRKIKDMQIGDQIVVPLKGFGKFTATVQKKDKNSILFLLDECVALRPMNENNTNAGGFASSDLCKWLNTTLLAAFPDYLRERLSQITLPTYGQIFGHDDFYKEHVEEDHDNRFSLMESRKNRIAEFLYDFEWYWLSNAIRNYSASFALVGTGGHAGCGGASGSGGVRPAFLLKF